MTLSRYWNPSLFDLSAQVLNLCSSLKCAPSQHTGVARSRPLGLKDDPSCSEGTRGHHRSGHELASVPKGSTASFKTCQHAGKGRTRNQPGLSWGKAGGCYRRGESGSGKAPTAASLRELLVQTPRFWVRKVPGAKRSGNGREGAAWVSFPCSISPGSQGRGRHLTACTNFSLH